MLRVALAQARPGMTLALPVFHPKRPDVVLLRPGVALDQEIIEKLGELRPGELWIRYPGLDHLEEYISPGVLAAGAAVTGQVAEALDAVVTRSHARLDYYAYRRAVGRLLERFIEHPKSALFIHEMGGPQTPATRHASNVCVLSVLMGLKLDFYLLRERARLNAAAARDVSNLGVGAMLHDVGMLRLRPEIAERWNRTLDETDAEWRRHVHIGQELLHDHIDPSAVACVLHHHQRFDGSGFPRRVTLADDDAPVAGHDIHVFARIVAAADVFDRLRHPPNRPDATVPAVRVLREMLLGRTAAALDPVVRTALASVTPAYAPGTLVKLSNGRQGVVTNWSAAEPCRPTVEAIATLDPRAREPRAETYDLRRSMELSVIEAEGQDVSADNFYAATPGQFDIAVLAEAMENRADALEQEAAARGAA